MLADIKTVGDVLDDKDRPVLLLVQPDTPVIEALMAMEEAKQEAVLVMVGDTFAGIFTEHDHCAKGELECRYAARTTVAEIMTPAEKVISVTKSTSLEAASVLMENNHVRHLPAIEGGKLLGVISIWDILRGVIHHEIFLAQAYLGGTIGRT